MGRKNGNPAQRTSDNGSNKVESDEFRWFELYTVGRKPSGSRRATLAQVG